MLKEIVADWFGGSRPDGSPTRLMADTSDGWKIALYRYESEGHRTPVILCHGMGSNRHNMDGPGRVSVARYLASQGYDVWVAELRGAGNSTKPNWVNGKRYNWTFEDYVHHDAPAILRTVLQATGATKVHWVGHSMGGMIAYALLMTPIHRKLASVVTLGSPIMSEVGHPLLDFGLPYYWLLRFAPGRIPIGTCARLLSPFAPLIRSLYAQTIEQLGWHGDNADTPLLRRLMATAVEDLPASLLREFARWYETKQMSDRYGMFDFTENLEQVRTPLFVIAGSADGLTPPRDLENVYKRVGSLDKAFQVVGRAYGFAHDYSHADLILGVHAPDDVYPLVLEWLEEHRSSRTRRRREDAATKTQAD